jgi:uncharacterized protein (DUF488 family)
LHQSPKQLSDQKLWTIGHGSKSFDAVADALNRHGVQMIVDVRSQPYSRRFPEFTKQELEDATASAGFGYRWLGDKLGGKPIPAGENLEAGLDELAGLCASSHVALLCAEADPRHCHRDAILAPAMESRGYVVIHILPDEAAAPHQDHLDLSD